MQPLQGPWIHHKQYSGLNHETSSIMNGSWAQNYDILFKYFDHDQSNMDPISICGKIATKKNLHFISCPKFHSNLSKLLVEIIFVHIKYFVLSLG